MYCIHVLRIYIYIWVVYPVDFVSSSCKKGLLSIKGDGELGLSRSMEKSAFNRSLLRDCPRALLAHERSIVQKRISHDGILQKEWSRYHLDERDNMIVPKLPHDFLSRVPSCPDVLKKSIKLPSSSSQGIRLLRRRRVPFGVTSVRNNS